VHTVESDIYGLSGIGLLKSLKNLKHIRTYCLLRYFIILQCDEIFGSIEGNSEIARWSSMLSAGKVYHISVHSVDAATEGEKNVVDNKLRLIFTPKTTLLSVIEECPDIPFQHLLPFVSFHDVPPRSRTCDNVIGIYNLHLLAVFLCMFFHVFITIPLLFVI